MATPEGIILNSILEYLAVRRIWCRRMNTGAIEVDKRFFRYGSVGMADILCTPTAWVTINGVTFGRISVVWIEVKTAKGKQSPAQVAFQKEVESEGHGYVVARSIEDVDNYLRSL